MEDSSTNPYIPQESQDIRQKVYQHQSPLGRIVKWLLITTILVAVLVGGGLFYVIPLTSAVDNGARQKFADVLQPPEQTLKRVNVQSDVGFSLNYDNRLYTSYAEVGDSTAGTDESVAVLSGQTYENNDLRTERGYNYVRIRPIESVEASRALITLPPEIEVFATMSTKKLDDASKLAENKDLSKLSLFVKLDGDERSAKKVADDNTFVTIEATKPSNTTINQIEYQRVRYTTTNENYRISNTKYDDCYYTIQFDQPYSICISNVRPTNVSAASLVEQVFDSIAFVQPQASEITPAGKTATQGADVSYVYPLARLAQTTLKTTDEDSTDGTNLLTITPEYYSDGEALRSIAKSQPSVVRVGTLYCADLDLKFEDGETATTLTDACVGNIASGVLVSSDGYVATTGHAIRTQKKAAINGYINFAPNRESTLDRLQRVLDYLLEAKIILESDAEYFTIGAQTGDQEALAKIQNLGLIIPNNYITPVKEEYTYAIQPTDKPIVVNRNDALKPSFAYSDSVLEADYVSSDYDAEKAVQYVFGSTTPDSDVGLLKVKGDFPSVPIAQQETAKSDDVVSTIGFTSYTDSTLTIDGIRDLPVATVSKVDQAYEKDGQQLLQTDKPVLPGNDGAPVFNSNGELIGFAIYGLLYCPDQQCFAGGTIRSASELLNLVEQSNLTLNTGGVLATQWRDGVDQFLASNYSASTSSFNTAGDSYRFNRWATPSKDLSISMQGSEKDTSLMNQLQFAMIVTLVSLILATGLLSVFYRLHKRRISMLQVGHYGADTPSTSPTQPRATYNPAAAPSVPNTTPGSIRPDGQESQVIGQQQTPPPSSNEDPFYK